MTVVLLRLPEVMRRVGLKKTAIYERINAGKFPKPVADGGASRRLRPKSTPTSPS